MTSPAQSQEPSQRDLDELEEILEYLDMMMYFETFISAGFGSWDKLMNITEAELESLHVKIGHRRKLQRYIASERGFSNTTPLEDTVIS